MNEIIQTILSQVTIVSAIAIPIIVGLVGVCKKAGVSDRFLPILSLVFGILIAMLFAVILGIKLLIGLVIGIIIGLSASGLYRSVKVTVLGE